MRIQYMCHRFLWKGKQDGHINAWVRWDLIALPKKWGGWGLKNLESFSKALAAKMGWQILTAKSLWTEVVYQKYIWPLHTLDWIRLPTWNRMCISSIWHIALNSISYIRDGLVWRIRLGTSIRVGMDPWFGCGNTFRLSPDLIQFLSNVGINYLDQIADPKNPNIFTQAWKSAIHLGILIGTVSLMLLLHHMLGFLKAMMNLYGHMPSMVSTLPRVATLLYTLHISHESLTGVGVYYRN